MRLEGLAHLGTLSSELFHYIVDHWQLPYNTTVQFVNSSHMRRVIVPLDIKPVSIDWIGEDINITPPHATVNTYEVELIKFASYYGESVNAGYLPSNNTLYIDIVEPYRVPVMPKPIDTPQHKPLVWHKNPNESVFVYGDRMFKTDGNAAHIDNPRKRREYQKAVFKTIIDTMRGK